MTFQAHFGFILIIDDVFNLYYQRNGRDVFITITEEITFISSCCEVLKC